MRNNIWIYVLVMAMTVFAILDATESPYAGLAALIIGGYAAYKDLGLFKVTVLCCISVLILELFV